jgi:asparagine synthetase B (glutamine-hydrolysing)
VGPPAWDAARVAALLPFTLECSSARHDPSEVRRFALQRVRSRIPEQPGALFTTLGGIDSQFVTASVARELGGAFGGAITVVPYDASAVHSDLPDVQATLALLASEGIHIDHHIAQLTPDFVARNFDRLIKLLGPDLFHLLCGLAEDLVAATAQQHGGGRVIMTAGGPDEAGRSYDRWTFLHRGLNEELAWYRLCEQFGSSEGVRAALVFGERGLENRVPLADLIDLATGMHPEQKQRVLDEGDGFTLASLRMQSKIFWRRALAGLLPERCLAAKKQPIHGSTGALAALHAVVARDRAFQACRDDVAQAAWHCGWNGIVFGDLRQLDRTNQLTECQLYALHHFSALEPELFRWGGERRYGKYVGYLPRSADEPSQRVHKPLCYDWQLGWDVPVRAML